jgi:hypothetical protein
MADRVTQQDKKLIAELKAERHRLRQQLSYISDSQLAKKFEVSLRTVQRIPEAWVL